MSGDGKEADTVQNESLESGFKKDEIQQKSDDVLDGMAWSGEPRRVTVNVFYVHLEMAIDALEEKGWKQPANSLRDTLHRAFNTNQVAVQKKFYELVDVTALDGPQ